MKNIKRLRKSLKNLDRSQILVALFLGFIILFSTFNLIRDLSSYGIRPFGFVENVFAQVFHIGDVVAADLPTPGAIPTSACSNGQIDLLQYMFADGAPSYNIKYCTKDGPGPVPQNFQIVSADKDGSMPGKAAFKVQKGSDYELYTYDNQNIYFIEDTSWDGQCPNGQRAYYRVYNGNNQLGGAIPRCWTPGDTKESPQKIKRFIRDSDTPSGTACTSDFETTTPTYQLNYASSGGNGPQVSDLYKENGTVVLKTTGGAGVGEEKYYSKGYGLTGFYFDNAGTVEFHSSIQTDAVDPTLKCGGEANNPASISLQSPKQDIVDQSDRCVAYNPRSGKAYKSVNPGGGTSLEDGKGGMNQGMVGEWNSEIDFALGKNSLKRDLKMGNMLQIFTGPSDVKNATDFVKNANDAGFLPIIRMCFVGGCTFNLFDNSIPDFYKAVSDSVGPDNVFVAILGPNEPGTGGEMTAFGVSDGDYQSLVNRANDFAATLQDYRVIDGGNMYLTPAIFNLTNRQNDDTKEYLNSGRGLNLGLFDYLAGNTYNTDGQSAYFYYDESGMKQAVESNGLKTLITEFGKFGGSVDSLKSAFKQFCDDKNVEGILFFRSFKNNERFSYSPKPDPLDIADIYSMTSSCTKPRQWVNCNFDSAIYPDNPNKKELVSADSSTAKSISTDTPNNNSAAPYFKVSCAGDNCAINIKQTIRYNAPIKQFGSNSSFGTETKNYTPLCVNVASQLHDDRYDALNQFAGKLGMSYPMPWLGSAINCSSELIKYDPSFLRFADLKSYPSSGSIILNSKEDIEGDLTKSDVARMFNGATCITVLKDGSKYIPDERTVYYKGQIVDKCPVDTIKVVRYYNPFSTPNNFSKPSNNPNNMKYLDNPDDYIYGPEVETGNTTVDIGNPSMMCSLIAERNVDPNSKIKANSDVDCSVKNDTTCSAFAPCTTEDVKGGKCYLNSAYYSPDTVTALRNECFNYNPKSTDRIYSSNDSFAALPSDLSIPNIYDSLYRTYQRLNDSLKNRNLKLVVNNNLGWKIEGFSLLRDGNSVPQTTTQSGYLLTDPEKPYIPDFENDPTKTANLTQPVIFNNNATLARGNNVKETDYYYDWLGYLDVFQEYWSVYQANNELSGEVHIPNPFYGKAGEPNSDKKEILISGLANKFVSVPILTCDQMQIGKKYKSSDLLVNNDVKIAIETYLLDSNPQLKNSTNFENLVNNLLAEVWPYDFTITTDDVTCITDINDNRFVNKLEIELCKRGYFVDGACGNQCTPSTTPAPVSSPNGGSDFALIYPTKTTVVGSPYGCEALRKGDCHTGTDFILPQGESIYAAESGTVIAAGSDRSPNKEGKLAYTDCYGNASGSYGCYVKIKHANGWVTLYGHMSQVLVSEGQSVTKGQEIGKIGETGFASGPHLHFEVRSKCDQYDGADLGKCTIDPMTVLSEQTTQTFINACDPQNYSISPWKGKCNEWNCGGAQSFQDSLKCITDIGYFHNTMDEWIDRYGPFCDNETYATKVLPFGYNFTKFYDTYLPPKTLGGRACDALPPSDRRASDIGMACPAYGDRVGTEAYNYYRGALKSCSLPQDQTYWTTANSFGKSPEDLATYMTDTLNVNYLGYALKDTPKEKIINVLEAAKAKNLNPFIVIGIWGTESFFGQFNKDCNISL